MSAYACEPGRGSEPEVGWQWALQMARFHDVTVVTRANNREAIERALPREEALRPRFIYYDLPAGMIWLKRRGLPVAIYYLLWQAGVRLHLRARLREFDLIHHVTFNSLRQPGFWWFCGRPVLLGPLGGGQVCPWRFLGTFGGKMLPEALRSLSVLASPLMPHLHLSFHFATRILTANQDTRRRIPRRYHPKVFPLLETGIPSGDIPPVRPRPSGGPARFIWVSRLEKIKACALVIEALARALKAEPSLQLSIVGDGPDNAFVRDTARRLGVTEAIRWLGRQPKSEIPKLLEQHDVFIFSSLRDTSGNVLLEGMAAGLPAITLRHHGAAEIATDETAIRIPPVSVRQLVSAMSEAMLALARAPERRARLGAAARERMLEVYAWERKGEQMNRLYVEAAGKINAGLPGISPI